MQKDFQCKLRERLVSNKIKKGNHLVVPFFDSMLEMKMVVDYRAILAKTTCPRSLTLL